MKIAIRYLSVSEKQNGVKLANAISEVAGVEALPIDKPLEEEVDVLFLVNAMYGFMIDSKVGEFIGKNGFPHVFFMIRDLFQQPPDPVFQDVSAPEFAPVFFGQ